MISNNKNEDSLWNTLCVTDRTNKGRSHYPLESSVVVSRGCVNTPNSPRQAPIISDAYSKSQEIINLLEGNAFSGEAFPSLQTLQRSLDCCGSDDISNILSDFTIKEGYRGKTPNPNPVSSTFLSVMGLAKGILCMQLYQASCIKRIGLFSHVICPLGEAQAIMGVACWRKRVTEGVPDPNDEIYSCRSDGYQKECKIDAELKSKMYKRRLRRYEAACQDYDYVNSSNCLRLTAADLGKYVFVSDPSFGGGEYATDTGKRIDLADHIISKFEDPYYRKETHSSSACSQHDTNLPCALNLISSGSLMVKAIKLTIDSYSVYKRLPTSSLDSLCSVSLRELLNFAADLSLGKTTYGTKRCRYWSDREVTKISTSNSTLNTFFPWKTPQQQFEGLIRGTDIDITGGQHPFLHPLASHISPLALLGSVSNTCAGSDGVLLRTVRGEGYINNIVLLAHSMSVRGRKNMQEYMGTFSQSYEEACEGGDDWGGSMSQMDMTIATCSNNGVLNVDSMEFPISGANPWLYLGDFSCGWTSANRVARGSLVTQDKSSLYNAVYDFILWVVRTVDGYNSRISITTLRPCHMCYFCAILLSLSLRYDTRLSDNSGQKGRRCNKTRAISEIEDSINDTCDTRGCLLHRAQSHLDFLLKGPPISTGSNFDDSNSAFLNIFTSSPLNPIAKFFSPEYWRCVFQTPSDQSEITRHHFITVTDTSTKGRDNCMDLASCLRTHDVYDPSLEHLLTGGVPVELSLTDYLTICHAWEIFHASALRALGPLTYSSKKTNTLIVTAARRVNRRLCELSTAGMVTEIHSTFLSTMQSRSDFFMAPVFDASEGNAARLSGRDTLRPLQNMAIVDRGLRMAQDQSERPTIGFCWSAGLDAYDILMKHFSLRGIVKQGEVISRGFFQRIPTNKKQYPIVSALPPLAVVLGLKKFVGARWNEIVSVSKHSFGVNSSNNRATDFGGECRPIISQISQQLFRDIITQSTAAISASHTAHALITSALSASIIRQSQYNNDNIFGNEIFWGVNCNIRGRALSEGSKVEQSEKILRFGLPFPLLVGLNTHHSWDENVIRACDMIMSFCQTPSSLEVQRQVFDEDTCKSLVGGLNIPFIGTAVESDVVLGALSVDSQPSSSLDYSGSVSDNVVFGSGGKRGSESHRDILRSEEYAHQQQTRVALRASPPIPLMVASFHLRILEEFIYNDTRHITSMLLRRTLEVIDEFFACEQDELFLEMSTSEPSDSYPLQLINYNYDHKNPAPNKKLSLQNELFQIRREKHNIVAKTKSWEMFSAMSSLMFPSIPRPSDTTATVSQPQLSSSSDQQERPLSSSEQWLLDLQNNMREIRRLQDNLAKEDEELQNTVELKSKAGRARYDSEVALEEKKTQLNKVIHSHGMKAQKILNLRDEEERRLFLDKKKEKTSQISSLKNLTNPSIRSRAKSDHAETIAKIKNYYEGKEFLMLRNKILKTAQRLSDLYRSPIGRWQDRERRYLYSNDLQTNRSNNSYMELVNSALSQSPGRKHNSPSVKGSPQTGADCNLQFLASIPKFKPVAHVIVQSEVGKHVTTDFVHF